ncbi:ATP-binding protein [Streptomyces sp. NPDC056304]|uniref:ATP-binding protein n=1 Tax=Streptomyces sp. NPDC056304 TaxID=3345778 RepID=UPI0035D9BC38
MRLEVRDSGPGRPAVQHPDDNACPGRGLQLADELADDFGVDDHVVGKTVRLVFKTAPAPLTTPGSS